MITCEMKRCLNYHSDAIPVRYIKSFFSFFFFFQEFNLIVRVRIIIVSFNLTFNINFYNITSS